MSNNLEPEEESGWWIGPTATAPDGIQTAYGLLINVHNATLCEGRGCPIHHPSDHHMKDWPTLWRDDRKIMERTCPHGVGHPDFDDAIYRASIGDHDTIHGCDGCCVPPEK